MTEPNLQNVAKNFVVTLDGSYIRYLTVLKWYDINNNE